MPIRKIPTVSRRIDPLTLGALSVIVLGVLATAMALLVHAH